VDRLVNGELLRAAEEADSEVLVTTDKNMASQQNLKGRIIAIVVLGNSQWRIVQRYVRRIAASVNAVTPAATSRLTPVPLTRQFPVRRWSRPVYLPVIAAALLLPANANAQGIDTHGAQDLLRDAGVTTPYLRSFRAI